MEPVSTERERWNAKFLAGEAQSEEADSLLVEVCSDLRPGSALDLAGGAGRHALWLAQRGWQVTLSDIADEGIAIAAQRSSQQGVAVSLRREAAADTFGWAAQDRMRFDLITVFWCLVRENFEALPGLLTPGGVLIYKTYTSEHARFAEETSTRFALHPGELRTAFPALETVLYREEKGVAELVARAG